MKRSRLRPQNNLLLAYALGATQVEKATLNSKKFGFTQKRDYSVIESSEQQVRQTVQGASIPSTVCDLRIMPNKETYEYE